MTLFREIILESMGTLYGKIHRARARSREKETKASAQQEFARPFPGLLNDPFASAQDRTYTHATLFYTRTLSHLRAFAFLLHTHAHTHTHTHTHTPLFYTYARLSISFSQKMVVLTLTGRITLIYQVSGIK